MAELKWIKIVTDIFESPKISLIESEKKSDEILIVWFKLLCLAGRLNNSGIISLANKPYNEEMIASAIRRKLPIVQKSLSIFKEYNMVEQINGAYAICNWAKHQSADRIEKENERMKTYMQGYRAKQKGLTKALCNANGNTNVSGADIDIDKDLKETPINGGKESVTVPITQSSKIDFESIGKEWNETMKGKAIPQVRLPLSQVRKTHIGNRIAEHGIEVFHEMMKKVLASDFCNGAKNGWIASFDWCINSANFTKIIEGNYDNKGNGKSTNGRPDPKIDWLDAYMDVVRTS